MDYTQLPNNSALLTRDAPNNSNRFTHYPGFGFQRRHGARPASVWLTGETESGTDTHPTFVAPRYGTIWSRAWSSCPTTITWFSSVDEPFCPAWSGLAAGCL